MKNLFLIAILAFAVSSCGGGVETPESIAKTWCEMNKKIESMDDVDAKAKLKKEQKAFEHKIEGKYKDNKEFMNKVEALADACD